MNTPKRNDPLLDLMVDICRGHAQMLGAKPKPIPVSDEMVAQEAIRRPVKFPRGDLLAYYFRLRRQGFTPRGARNCTCTHAQATEIRFPAHAAAELTAHYARPGAYTGD